LDPDVFILPLQPDQHQQQQQQFLQRDEHLSQLYTEEHYKSQYFNDSMPIGMLACLESEALSSFNVHNGMSIGMSACLESKVLSVFV
jgi:hypothetical protein